MKNKSTIKKELKYYESKDFSRLSDEIDTYLSEFTDETMNLLPPNIDVQSIEFLLYELLINIYKHSKFKNAYIQVIITDENQNIEIHINDDGRNSTKL